MLDEVTRNAWALTNFFPQGSSLNAAFNYEGVAIGGSARQQYDPVTNNVCANVNNDNMATGKINWSVCFNLSFMGSPLLARTGLNAGRVYSGTLH